MVEIGALPLYGVIGVFLASAAVIAVAGWRLSGVADQLADRTGLGEIVAGALFVGAATSLPGAITSMTTAAAGAAGVAVGNALGGLTAQTAFIAVADLFYRRANLEHAAATVPGLAQGVLLMALLCLPLIASSEPAVTVMGVHPVSLLIPVAYGLGLFLMTQIKALPMWRPVETDETRSALSEEDEEAGGSSLWTRFLIYAAATAISGYFIGEASLGIVEKTPLSESAVGTVFAAIANSLPELVTAIAAVRIGAVSLAVGDIIGGNAFEVMFLCAADVFYDGSIYTALEGQDRTTALIAMLMTAIVVLGMIRRQKSGIATIGFESCLVLALYVVSIVLLFV